MLTAADWSCRGQDLLRLQDGSEGPNVMPEKGGAEASAPDRAHGGGKMGSRGVRRMFSQRQVVDDGGQAPSQPASADFLRQVR